MNAIPHSRIDQNAIKAWRMTSALLGLLWLLPALLYLIFAIAPSLEAGLSWNSQVNW